jgi:hypothetical protein
MKCPSKMPTRGTCTCGACKSCRRRAYADSYYQRPDVKARLVEKHKKYRFDNAAEISDKKAEWRQENRERLNEKARTYKQTKKLQPGDKRRLARKKALYAVRTGKLIPQRCEICGAFPILSDGRRGVWAHHDNYDKPLAVRWLCVVCHGVEHRRINRGQ